jgi:hypothetical protein
MNALFWIALLLFWLMASLALAVPIGRRLREATRAEPLPANDNEPPQRRGIAS